MSVKEITNSERDTNLSIRVSWDRLAGIFSGKGKESYPLNEVILYLSLILQFSQLSIGENNH